MLWRVVLSALRRRMSHKFVPGRSVWPGPGPSAVGALIGANVIANDIAAEVLGSSVTSGSTIDLIATNDSNVLGLSVGVAGSAAVAGLLSLTGNVISNTTVATIVDGSGLRQSLSSINGGQGNFIISDAVDTDNDTITLGRGPWA